MGVHIDKAGGDNLASGIDFFAACTGNFSDFRDPAVFDGNVSIDQFTATAIGNGAAAYYQVIVYRHDRSSPSSMPVYPGFALDHLNRDSTIAPLCI